MGLSFPSRRTERDAKKKDLEPSPKLYHASPELDLGLFFPVPLNGQRPWASAPHALHSPSFLGHFPLKKERLPIHWSPEGAALLQPWTC